MNNVTSQEFETFLPVYDMVPQDWEEARQFLVEHLKKISNAVNNREIGWLLDEELLNGQQLFPGVSSPNDQTFRSVFRKVVDMGALSIGTNSVPHGITIDSNFTLLHAYAGATNYGALTSEPIPNGADTMSLTATNVVITVAATWDECIATIEYTQEK